MKRIISSIVISCMVMMTLCSVCFAQTFSAAITAGNGSVGDTITVTVAIPENTNAAGGSFNLIYDNTKMTLVDAIEGDILSGFSKTVNKTYAENKVRLNFAGNAAVSSSGGVILTATFKLTAPGTASFSTEKFKLADIDTNYLSCENTSCSITIEGGASEDVFVPIITAESGTVGDTINVKVSIPANTNAAGGSFNLVYDNTKMALVDAIEGDIISAFSKTVNKTYAENKVRLNFAGDKAVSASGGVILTATFELTSPGTASFSTEKFKLADIDTNYLSCENTESSITISENIPTETAEITVSSGRATIGKQFSVSINIPENPGIALIGFDVDYDSSAMTLESITAGDIFVEAEMDGNVSKVPFSFTAYTGKENKTGDGVLVTLNFLVPETAVEGDYTVSLKKIEALDIDENDVSFKAVDGTITVSKIEPGDVTGDGKLSLTDLLRLAKYFSGWEVVIDEIGADTNGDGAVTLADLLRLAKYYSGWEVTLG